MARVKITEFGVIQKLLARATVQVFLASDSGENTGFLATLYKEATGTDQVSNPQILDENGKLPVDCYVQESVMAEISNISDLANRSLSRIKANPLEYPLGSTNAALEGASVDGAVIDAEAAAVQAGTYLGLIEDTFQGIPSTTSLSISTGSKTFTVASGLPFGVGQYILATSNANPTTHSINGQITAYSGTSLTITVDAFLGSGSRADWTIRTSGPRGATGATGPSGSGAGDMLKSENLSGLSNYATARSNLGLGTAAQSSSSSFATAAQGAKADTALQPADVTNLGALVLLATYSAAAAASVDITSILSSTYDDYLIICNDIAPSIDNSILMLRTSTDNGSHWDQYSGAYRHATGYPSDTATGISSGGSPSDVAIYLANAVGNASQEDSNVILYALNVNSTTKYKKFTWTGSLVTASGNFYAFIGAAKAAQTSVVNALQIKFYTGAISGTVKVYGMKK